MPTDRQPRQQNAPTCEDGREHQVSTRQHRQHTPQPVLTLLTWPTPVSTAKPQAGGFR